MNKVESALSRTTDTKALVIGIETLPRVADMFKELFPGRRALVVADANTWRAAGSDVHRILAQAGIAQDEPHVFTDPKLYAEWTFVEQLDGVLSRTDAIPVAVGSGVINDLTKLCSHHNGRRYMVVGTAASMDGYTAYGASITKDGNKQTFDCPAPLGMVLDPTIAAAAPAKMSASGYADLIAKIPAGADSRYDLKLFVWHHIAVTFDRGTICVYIDGKLKDTAKASVSGTDGQAVIIDKINFAIPHSDETDGKERCFWIGHSYRLQSDGDLFYERRFDGMMGEVRLWNKALTSEEIASENHFYKIDPASDGLVAYWKFDDNTKGKIVKDYTGNGFDLKTEREVNWQSVALPEE